jgi:hypothetical protein
MLSRVLFGAAATALLLVAPGQARASTTRTVIDVPLRILDNLCAGAEPVSLSGHEYITTTTTPRAGGGFTVRASIVAPDLIGAGMVSQIPYHGVDGQQTYEYVAPAPYPSTSDVTLYTLLQPLYGLPTMYFVTVLRQVVLSDGTAVTTFRDMRLTCTQPKCSHVHRS